MEKTLQVINENLKMYCKDYNVVQRDMNNNVMKLCEIVLDEYEKMCSSKNLLQQDQSKYDFIDINDSIEIVANFYKGFDDSLYNSFLNVMYDKGRTKIKIGDKNDSVDINNTMYLYLGQNISDIYTITHESAHKIFQNFLQEPISIGLINRLTFVEINSITLERLIAKQVDDNNEFLKARTESDFLKVIVYLFIEWISEIYRKYNTITQDIFRNELHNIKNENMKKAFFQYLPQLLNKVANNELYGQLLSSRYILGSVLSSTLSKRIESKELSKEEYIKMMSGLNRIETFEEALDLLDLNYLKNNDILNAVKRDYDSCCAEIFESRKR